MTDSQIIKVLQTCHPIYVRLHNKINCDLSKQEIVLLGKFKVVWEDELCRRPELIKDCGLSPAEIAFLGGYIYFTQLKIDRQLSTV